MKKILLILPILGTCSYLFGQAPEINVHAMQEQGTKDVFIEFNASGKEGENELYYEVWFRQNSAFDWSQVSSLENAFDASPVDAVEGDFNGEWKRFSYKRGLTPWMEMVNLRWKAGIDVPDISSQDAQIRIVGFYPKKDEFGSLLTQDQQVSGWNGIGEFGNNVNNNDTNGSNEELDVYYIDDATIGGISNGHFNTSGHYAFEVFFDDATGQDIFQIIAVDSNSFTRKYDIAPANVTNNYADISTFLNIPVTYGMVSQGKLMPDTGI